MNKWGMDELLRGAQKVYIRRHGERQKAKAKLMVAMVQEVTKQNQMGARGG